MSSRFPSCSFYGPDPPNSGASGGDEPEESLLKTGEVLKGAGVSRQVLYRYMQMELIEPAQVTDTGRHFFRESVYKQIKRIQQLNESGYTLRDIREIFGARIRAIGKS